MKCNNELGDKIDPHQVCMNALKISKCALEESSFCSHRDQVTENQTEAELQQTVKSQPQRVSAVKIRAVIGKEWDSVSFYGERCMEGSC